MLVLQKEASAKEIDRLVAELDHWRAQVDHWRTQAMESEGQVCVHVFQAWLRAIILLLLLDLLNHGLRSILLPRRRAGAAGKNVLISCRTRAIAMLRRFLPRKHVVRVMLFSLPSSSVRPKAHHRISVET